MSFEDYLLSKKIDGRAFQSAEPALYEQWANEFVQMHANSFTAQKLYLINPIRRKYTAANVPTPAKSTTGLQTAPAAQTEVVTPLATTLAPQPATEPTAPQPSETKTQNPAKPARPVFKPKPKIS